jgi:multiple sugar transport system substrate-binding protein
VRRTLIILIVVTACGGRQKKKDVSTLTLWHAYGGALGEQFEALVDEFNQTHPDIVVQPSYGGSLWTMRDKLFTAIAGGAAPDLAQAGAIERLQDWLGDMDREDVWPLAWETVTYDGAIWSMPFSLSNIALYYNRSLFSAAGLDPHAPPATWDELAASAAALTGDGQTSRWGLSFPLQASQGVVYYWFAFLWQAGGEIFDGNFETARFQQAPGIEALAFLQTLVEAGSMPLAPPEEGFEKGQIGMTLASTARLQLYVQALGDDLGVAPLPSGPAGAATGVGGANLSMLSGCHDKQAAWTFIAWMTSPDVNLRWSIGSGYLPLRRSVVASPAYQDYLAAEPRARVILEQMDAARARPNVPAYAAASREIGLAVEQALFTSADPATALTAAAAQVNAILDAGGHRLH